MPDAAPFHFELLRSIRVPKAYYSTEDLRRLGAFVVQSEKIRGAVQLALELTGHDRIHELNRHFRGVDRTTDVISFRYPASEGPLILSEGKPVQRRAERTHGLSGDIAINVEQAKLQAGKMGHSVRREIRLLWIHGILHLLDYTDYEPEERRRMFQRQNTLLRRWERMHA